MFSRRHLVLAVLVVALGAAVYLNWSFSNTDDALGATGALDADKTLGEAYLVGNNNTTTDMTTGAAKDAEAAYTDSEYFAAARQDREKARKGAIEVLDEVIGDPKASAAEKEKAITSKTDIANNMQEEANVESLIKAKGFKECLAVISEKGINIIVKTDKLLPSESLQIKDIVMDQTKVEPENIKIIEVK